MHVFTCQVWFVGEKLGEGVGKTRKEAQHRAADMSLRNLAGMLLPFIVARHQLLMNLNNICRQNKNLQMIVFCSFLFNAVSQIIILSNETIRNSSTFLNNY